MRKNVLCCIAILLLTAVRAVAQESYNDRAKKYIGQYFTLAINEQKCNGVPASITLGQGILETEAGTSELVTQANNHFGIKCKNGWQGETFLHTDDAKDECFKKYKCVEDSYRDHSDHLKKNQRYACLFTLSKTDYASWAIGLKKCGYATNPQYAQKLIKIIEDFKLQEYTYAAMDSSGNYPAIPEPVASPETSLAAATLRQDTALSAPPAAITHVADTLVQTVLSKDTIARTAAIPAAMPETDIRKIADSARVLVTQPQPVIPLATAPPSPADTEGIVIVNGLKAFYAHKGDMLLESAMKYKIRYPRLLEMNDLPDAPLANNTYIYIEKKLTTGIRPQHTVEEDENMWSIAQKEGMQLKRLAALNMINTNEEPVKGAVLELQAFAGRKPEVRVVSMVAHKTNAIVIDKGDVVPKRDSDYISLRKPREDVSRTDTGFLMLSDTAKKLADKHPAAKKTKPASVHTTKPPVVKQTQVPGQIDTSKTVVVLSAKGAPEKTAEMNWSEPDTNDTAKNKEVAVAPGNDNKEDLSVLKAQLDKVVYADDSRLEAKAATPAPAKQEPTEAKTAKYYTVKRGDTAFSIAKKNGITVNQLLKWNDIDPDEIKVGKNLRVK